MAIPDVGETLISPSGNEYVVCDRAADEGRIELRDPYGTKLGWLRWSEMVRWRVKGESEISAAQWPDEAYQAAREWVSLFPDRNNVRENARHLYDAVHAETRRRESRVCGAHFMLSCACTKSPGHELPHFDKRVEEPECDRPHMTEAAERVIWVARGLKNVYPTLEIGIRDYDKERGDIT